MAKNLLQPAATRAPLESGAPRIVLPREFYRRECPTVARELLGKLLVVGDLAGRIIEVEAYTGDDDPGSHAYRGRTPRNAIMFGPPGYLYVYFTYGMHWCANAVCDDEGKAAAVLIRALHPVNGIDIMRAARRRARYEIDLCSGPAKLCQALGLTGEHGGADLVVGDRGVWIADDGKPPPRRPGRSGRIGLSAGQERRWRWFIKGDPNLSRRS